jgi:hypothetical protein
MIILFLRRLKTAQGLIPAPWQTTAGAIKRIKNDFNIGQMPDELEIER